MYPPQPLEEEKVAERRASFPAGDGGLWGAQQRRGRWRSVEGRAEGKRSRIFFFFFFLYHKLGSRPCITSAFASNHNLYNIRRINRP
jgi:hypothetical protein